MKVENSELPTASSSADSEVSPLYLDFDIPTDNSCESGTPQAAFLPNPSSNPWQNQLQLTEESECDEIEKMMELLGLSRMDDKTCCINSYNCEGSFYENIVGVKGPKCWKEVERLNGWIDFLYNGGDSEKRKEPFKLAHLLLGKASLLSKGDDDSELELDFPSTLDEYLKHDYYLEP